MEDGDSFAVLNPEKQEVGYCSVLGARCNSPLAYDSKNKLIALLGGDAQDHYLPDTWVYDCAKRR